jgi:WD40 repeat protein
MRSPQTPAYRHGHEPYRAVVSPDGARVASGDWNGTVEVWSTTQQRILADLPQLHRARVSGLAWTADGRLVTAGLDGVVHMLSPALEVIRSWRTGAAVVDVQMSSQAIHATLTDNTLWSVSLTTGTEYRVALDAMFTTLAVSPRGTVAAGTDSGELIIIDSDRRIATRYFEHGGVTCAAFEDEQTLLACVQDGRVVRLHVDMQTSLSKRNESP